MDGTQGGGDNVDGLDRVSPERNEQRVPVMGAQGLEITGRLGTSQGAE